jgi:diguanylate cyclase (GGDEF)-like protein
MKLTAIPRITLGLVSVSLSLLLFFDFVLHLFPSEIENTRGIRTRVVRSLSIQMAILVEVKDMRLIIRTLESIKSRDEDILSIGLRQSNGTLVAQAGNHKEKWSSPTDSNDSLNAMSLGILSDKKNRWGQVEVSFRSIYQRGWATWIFSGAAKLFILFSVSATIFFYLFLRRTLNHLDPSAAVPERVRGAFDALTEGVVILDKNEQILLVNQSFQAMSTEPADSGGLVGRKASSLKWLRPEEDDNGATLPPWMLTMQSRQPQYRQSYRITHDRATVAKVRLSCSPLLGDRGEVRGCLITADDVTALEQSHEQLVEVLSDLAMSKKELQIKNIELEDLASHDPLSQCLNRRSFFNRMHAVFNEAFERDSEIICIMADIDHFKLINDQYGHAVGDEAIQCFAEILRSSVKQDDLVGRYGGEEFCVVIQGISLELAIQRAETMRQRLMAETRVGQALGHVVQMTASFGISALSQGAITEAELVDQADRAMYIAKKTGRNQVITYHIDQAANTRAFQATVS